MKPGAPRRPLRFFLYAAPALLAAALVAGWTGWLDRGQPVPDTLQALAADVESRLPDVRAVPIAHWGWGGGVFFTTTSLPDEELRDLPLSDPQQRTGAVAVVRMPKDTVSPGTAPLGEFGVRGDPELMRRILELYH